MSKSLLRKIIAIAAVILLVLCAWCFDLIRAQSFNIEVVYVSNTEPTASQYDTVYITFQVTRNGKPCENHEVEVRANGQFSPYLATTDSQGYVSFIYYPYDETIYEKAAPDEITVYDWSCSLLVEVPVTTSFTLYLKSPTAE